jgi:hypothetical protein
MVRILDTEVELEYPLGHHQHCLVAQVPVRLVKGDVGFVLEDRDAQWSTVRSVLDLAVAGEHGLRKFHVLMFPESSVPADRLDDVLARVDRFRPNTVTLLGFEHVRLRDYRAILNRFRPDNAAAIALLERDVEEADILDIPVNWCCTAVKEATGRLRVFLEAKTHPFHGEEFLDKGVDLYRGRHFYLFRSSRSPFNFMVLVCLDYLYRSPYESNIRAVIDHANELFFRTRQGLDALFVIQANPKPEHRAYRDVLTGFYGEYLEETPGVRETVTVFGNASEESAIAEHRGPGLFGASSVVMSRRHRLSPLDLPEFSTDDFGGAPLRRLRFRTATRLYYFNLPPPPHVDPRSSRLPLKVHTVLRPTPGGGARRVARPTRRGEMDLIRP